jgi:hypothetical protein
MDPRSRSIVLSVVVVLAVLGTGLQAATRPVSIGVNANFEQHLARSANLGWSRIDIVWSFINPQPGVWDFTVPDIQVNGATGAGQQILGILHRPPQWVGGGPNENIPPLTTTQWSEFVRRVAQRYAGRIAAYEIWNEPDQKSTSKVGIGWGRNIEEPPLYTDFVHAAAIEIRTYAPGTLVVAPTFQSRNNDDGADNRKRRILQQIQAATYPDGPGYSFVDVISAHNNARDTEASRTMGWRLNYENLAYVWNHAPSKRTAPVWVTEYGWRANAVGWAGQREKICNVTRIYTGRLEPAYTNLDDWDVRRAFIYLLKDPNDSRAIFRADNGPMPVVTEYLQRLAYPATQNPALSGEFPSCSGASFASTPGVLSTRRAEDLGRSLAELGLGDPRLRLPSGYSEVFAERSPDGRSLDFAFRDSAGGVLSVSVSPSSANNRDRSFLTYAGAEWTSGSSHISLSGMVSGRPHGKALLRSVATAMDPSFGKTCLIESISGSDESEVRHLGFSPPMAPPGFSEVGRLMELTRPTKACHGATSAQHPVIDFTWTFIGDSGETLRAGIYRYEDSSEIWSTSPRTLHWSDDRGTRFWVAVDAPEVTPALETKLYQVAESMDPRLRQ